jgi:hypothetical protein
VGYALPISHPGGFDPITSPPANEQMKNQNH